MRVLHVVECFEGGVGRAVDNLVAETPELDHHLLCAGAGTSQSARYRSITRLPDGLLGRVQATRRAIASVEPDVVHAHSSWAGVYVRVRREAGRVVYQPHCFSFVDPGLPWWRRTMYRAAERALARRTDVIVAVSTDERELAAGLGGACTVAVVPNAATVEVVEGRRRSVALQPQVAMAGRICPQKSPERFAELAGECKDAGADLSFVWIGDGDAEARRSLQSAGVRVTGWLNPVRVADELDHTDIYVHTARYEGFPISVLDAASRHVPIVARQIPALRHSGLVTAPDGKLADLVLTALGDAGMRQAMTRAGDALLAAMNQSVAAEALRAVYGSSASVGVGAA